MKISVEISLEPDEFPLAAELLAVLQRLTPHLRASHGPRIFEQLLKQVLYKHTRPEEAGRRIFDLLNAISGPEELAATLDDFFIAFQHVALTPDILTHDQALSSLMDVLPHIGNEERYVPETLRKLVEYLLSKLSRNRPLSAERSEFFAEAEAFAHVVRLDCIAVNAAVKAVTAMVRGQGTRLAGLTILGKLTELCALKVQTVCDPAHLRELQSALAMVTDDSLAYDVAYVMEHLLLIPSTPVNGGNVAGPAAMAGQMVDTSWSYNSASTGTSGLGIAGSKASVFSTAAEGSAAPSWSYIAALSSGSSNRLSTPTQGSGSLRALTSKNAFSGSASNRLMAIACDEVRDCVHGASFSNTVTTWTLTGQELAVTALPDGYSGNACDVLPFDDALVVASKDEKGSKTPLIVLLDLSTLSALPRAVSQTSQALLMRSCWTRPESKVVSCVKAWTRPGLFIVGESLAKTNRISLLDVSRSNKDSITTVQQWDEHEGIITSLSIIPDGGQQLFLSSSLDGSIRLWDARRGASSVMFVSRPARAGAPAGDTVGHTSGVLSVDTSSTYAVSCDFKQTLLTWDLRKLKSALGAASLVLPPAPNPVCQVNVPAMKACVSPDGETAAVALATSIKLVKLATGVVSDGGALTGKPDTGYTDLRWHMRSRRLVAAVRDGSVEVYDGIYE